MNLPKEVLEKIDDYLIGTQKYYKEYFNNVVLRQLMRYIYYRSFFSFQVHTFDIQPDLIMDSICFYCGGSMVYSTNYCECEAKDF